MRAVGAFQVLVAGFGEAQPPAAIGPGDVDGLAWLEPAPLRPAPQDAQCSAQLAEVCHGDPLEVGDTPAPPRFGVVRAEPAEPGQHVDRCDEPVAVQCGSRRGLNPPFEALRHHLGSLEIRVVSG
jgi:hypothetical protein